MKLGIEGRWALVCGSSAGLGLGCARALVQEGVSVVINARGAVKLGKAVDELRQLSRKYAQQAPEQAAPVVLPVAADITTPAGREAVFQADGGPGKAFDIVVNNAGGPPPGDFRQWGEKEWLAALQANMLTPIEIIRAVVDGMAERGFGRIVNITSSAVKAPIDILGLSNGARSGLTGFVSGLARSPLAGKGVTINNLLPGKFDTDRLRGTFSATAEKSGRSLDEVRTAQAALIPAGRFGTPDEFGAICAFLCSQQAAYVTGQNWLVDGGAYPGTF
ncbi:SDR family oxidoreductase [Corticibacter populi]|uniref:SDR family oxidoreductase n=1 Tax=Corticibacter populi TaxID=1550736 RepID=A0A3M6QYI7_9BURK|nr:SDR family oxidoreductase [Corticibacter populi]RMX08058.1 SDR family oxidoreductase [Corticibacter populi]RZS35303.1 3-oxoacyl-[acyl-carrier protein] reductase [Corticibacter populi]